MSQATSPHSPKWTAADIPDLTGRIFVVTGASSGLGLATTRELARHGAHVVLAVRDEAKGGRAAAGITAEVPGASLDVRRIDLADLDSVREFADKLRADHPHLDVLVNNAGVMAPPLTLSAQGHELQFAANHLGHFALTGLLLDRLAAGRGPRVVTVSSLMHRRGRIDFEALEHGYGAGRRYAPSAAYNQSKLVNTVFGHELHRRLTAAGSPVRSVLGHPGYSRTNLQGDTAVALVRWVYGKIASPLFAQPAAAGALPQLYVATVPGVDGGAFYGPDGAGELRGAPKPVPYAPAATDPGTGRRLWELSERLTGVRFPLG
ncbi:oxidoreductase [Streptomyces sp. NPDC090025]|uniref:oxidoreductase n=1 Tax=Streptomyces sp. NPDC090025 TaxID=3365922 RepID=UPI0038385714